MYTLALSLSKGGRTFSEPSGEWQASENEKLCVLPSLLDVTVSDLADAYTNGLERALG